MGIVDKMLEDNYRKVKQRIEHKCLDADRSIDEITLVAVSKTKPFDTILEALNLGIINFGENKAQELKQKSEICSEELNWHFIGHLQSNKAKDVVPVTELIHSADSKKLVREINKRAENIGKVQNILIEVNTSEEEAKYGLRTYEDIRNLAEYCSSLPNINLKGLMTMAPFTENEKIIRKSFRSLKDIFIKLNNEGFNLVDLSMGMTNDFEIAIEEGATILRIGTAIFGSRS